MPTSRIRPVVRLHHTIRSRATWYELGEKNKYFLNLENSNKKKSSVRKTFTRDGKLTNNPKKTMDELESFYADLYDGSTCPIRFSHLHVLK